MTRIKSLFVSLVLLGSAFALPMHAAQQTQDLASVEGTVVQAGTSAPLARTRLVLNSQDGRITSPPPPPGVTRVNVTMTVTTDDQGRFAFSNVPPGNFQLVATHDGFVAAAYGESAPTQSGKRFQLAPKQQLKNIVLSMTPTSTITGRIKNSFGEPVGNVTVEAHRYVFQGGRRVLDSVMSVLTNDLGEYRLYYLEPGQYIVTAIPAAVATAGPDGKVFLGDFTRLPGSPMTGSRNPERTTTTSALAALGVVGAADTGETYLPVFFPGTTDPATSTPIDLRPGASFENADFTIKGVRAVRVRGRILNAAGQSARGAHVLLMSQVTGYNYGLKEESGTVSDNGTFEFRGVAPGNYDLVATMGDLPDDISFPGVGYPGGAILETYRWDALPPGAAPPAPRTVAKTSIQVGGADVSNIALTLGPGYKVGGKITVDGHSGPESDAMTAGITIQLMPDPETFESAPMPAVVGANGSFTITGLVPGTYQVAILNADKMPPGTYVKSVMLDNVDAINPRLVISNEPRGQLEIVLGTKMGYAIATVVNAKQEPAAGAKMVLVPDAPRRQHFDLYKFDTANDSGRAVTSVEPGDYMAYAWESIEEGAWWDPAFLVKYEGLGKPVHITEGGTETLNLKLIPVR